MVDLNLPVGISDFKKIRENDYYYIDKSGLIAELLGKSSAEVTLITRPRRFGKTLGISMLDCFFNIQTDSSHLFAGLEISKNTALLAEWQNKWPVLFLSFRQVDGLNFQSSYEMLTLVIRNLFKKHLYLLDSDRVNPYDKQAIARILDGTASLTEIKDCLILMTGAMQAYYQKAVILLIDEYDVPLAKANSHGYYNEMLDLMRGLLQALKDNPALRFAVITGCLKIAKESIFTGTNNFVSDTIADSHLNEYFGFTQTDIDHILSDADATSHAEEIRHWYDGYHFGDVDVYCPWDVLNYMSDLCRNPAARPASYWKNTSDNAIIRSFLDYAGSNITKKLETLLAGSPILQRIDDNLTYDYLHSSEENLWTILYLTGYLTSAREQDLPQTIPDGLVALTIPNEEIREIFETTVMHWFDDTAKSWDRKALFHAVWRGDSSVLTDEINKLLRQTISYHDYREDFYHAFLAGIFAGAGYVVESNKEHGEGRSDILVFDSIGNRVAVFEVKYAKSADLLESGCELALQQIRDRMYTEEFRADYDQILCFGICFFRKRCLVKIKND